MDKIKSIVAFNMKELVFYQEMNVHIVAFESKNSQLQSIFLIVLWKEDR